MSDEGGPEPSHFDEQSEVRPRPPPSVVERSAEVSTTNTVVRLHDDGEEATEASTSARPASPLPVSAASFPEPASPAEYSPRAAIHPASLALGGRSSSAYAPSSPPAQPQQPQQQQQWQAVADASFATPDALKPTGPIPDAAGDDPLPFAHRPLYSATLLLTTAVLLLAMIGWGGGVADAADNPMVGPSPWALLHFGAKFTPIQLNHAEHWRPFASTFLYAGFVHLALGWAAGMPFMFHLERVYGTPRVFFCWITAGWSASSAALPRPSTASAAAPSPVPRRRCCVCLRRCVRCMTGPGSCGPPCSRQR